MLASFIGRVNAVEAGKAFCDLMHEDTDERFEAEGDARKLDLHGIKTGDEFRCRVVRKQTGNLSLELERLEPKEISPERAAQIRAELSDLGDF